MRIQLSGEPQSVNKEVKFYFKDLGGSTYLCYDAPGQIPGYSLFNINRDTKKIVLSHGCIGLEGFIAVDVNGKPVVE